MSNILKAFINIINNHNNHQQNINSIMTGNNRANNMGDGLEEYIKNAFASTFNETNEQNRLNIFSQTYSYSGNKSNPPDLILKNSDAIEIKKLESNAGTIALNSSYPKSKLFSNSHMITTVCKNCEENWNEKDMLYIIGNAPKGTNSLKSLWFVYGDCFCADKEIYEKIKDTISSGINAIPTVEFSPTNEIGKVKKVDPLGVTLLRLRGMWHIENPIKIFNYIYKYDETKSFQLLCLMKKSKYNSMPIEDRQIIEGLNNVSINDIKIKNINNPIQLMDGILLVWSAK